MNPYIIEEMIRERQRDALNHAERLRLLRQYEATQPVSNPKFLARLGALLIMMGEKLQKKYDPAHQLKIPAQSNCKS